MRFQRFEACLGSGARAEDAAVGPKAVEHHSCRVPQCVPLGVFSKWHRCNLGLSEVVAEMTIVRLYHIYIYICVCVLVAQVMSSLC